MTGDVGSEANQLRQGNIRATVPFQSLIVDRETNATVGSLVLQSIWEGLLDIGRVLLVVIGDSLSVHNVSLGVGQLKQEDPGQRLVSGVVKVDLESHRDFTLGAEHPV